MIYTIPYCKNRFHLVLDLKNYPNNLRNCAHTYKNITYLALYIGSVTENDEYYFPNIIELELILNSDTSLTIEHIEYLKGIVNLFNLEYLNIVHYKILSDTSLLLMIFKEARRLSSLTIYWSILTSFLADQELCNYFNTMIKTLCICDGNPDTQEDSEKLDFDPEKFCQIFSNVEHLRFGTICDNQLLFVFNRLSKLKTLQALWITNKHFDEDRIQFENKLQKLNLIYHIDTERYRYSPVNDIYSTDLRIWFENNTLK
jgi:hypothetical protein